MRDRIPSLDGLRAVSISLVIFGHLTGTIHFPKAFDCLAGLGQIGVLVFFVISGFLITTLLMGEEKEIGRISLGRFYARRALRIFPVLYVYLAVIGVLAVLNVIVLRPDDLVRAALYLMDYTPDRSWYVGHLWSLSVEEQFYLLWPLTFALFGVRRSWIPALCLLAAIPLSGLVLAWAFPRLPSTVRFPSGAQSVVTGCLLAICFEWLRTKRLLRSWVFTAGLVLAVALRLYLWNVERSVHGLSLAMNILIAIFILRCVVVPGDLLGRALNSRVMVFFGVTSYSLYVWQELFLNRQSPRSIFPYNVTMALGAGISSYLVIERPMLKVKNALSARVVGQG